MCQHTLSMSSVRIWHLLCCHNYSTSEHNRAWPRNVKCQIIFRYLREMKLNWNTLVCLDISKVLFISIYLCLGVLHTITLVTKVSTIAHADMQEPVLHFDVLLFYFTRLILFISYRRYHKDGLRYGCEIYIFHTEDSLSTNTLNNLQSLKGYFKTKKFV